MDAYDASMLKRKLRLAREYRGTPAQQLSEAVSVGVDAYYKWERPKENLPNHDKLAALSNTLRMDIRFFYLPDMTLESADLDRRPQQDAITQMAQAVQALETKLAPSFQDDPVLHAVHTRKDLHDFVEMLMKLNDHALAEAKGMVRGYFLGQESKGEDPATREDAG